MCYYYYDSNVRFDTTFIVFFFFKQKTAYEMLRSLVGSEMCIRDRDRSISDSLSKFEGKIYECRIAAKRYFCASAFSKCRQMKLPAGVPNVGVVPTFPTLPCKSVCKQYEAACGVTEESCNMLSNQKCNDLEKEDTSGYKRAEL
eukprot:TRINITY_DN11956_c0_g1_i7.p1 TRINITY_DN11956_c0_g1~~TRINITY_DN11956_c0_g1_i7.p1  ORF type:complete len:144 (-),score=35.45 TRINITY_DN11956_c0_g1_i7:389-820(-)